MRLQAATEMRFRAVQSGAELGCFNGKCAGDQSILNTFIGAPELLEVLLNLGEDIKTLVLCKQGYERGQFPVIRLAGEETNRSATCREENFGLPIRFAHLGIPDQGLEALQATRPGRQRFSLMARRKRAWAYGRAMVTDSDMAATDPV